jgi:hypothetical protein
VTVTALPHRLGIALNLCDRPAVTSVCASLVTDRVCGGLLAYSAGRWQHVNACRACLTGLPCRDTGRHRWCDDPQPQTCAHGSCGEPVDVHTPCAAGLAGCCGCCWHTCDDLEGRTLWPSSPR